MHFNGGENRNSIVNKNIVIPSLLEFINSEANRNRETL